MKNISEYCLVLLSTFFLCWLIYLCHFGIEPTDEGLYLITIANPSLYPDTISQFGLFYHPIYQLLNGDLPLLRITNLLALLALGTLTFEIILKQYNILENTKSRLHLTFPLSFLTIIFLNTWQPTPSYNTLNLMSLLVTFCCAFKICHDTKHSQSNFYIWALLGLALGISLLNKATSGALIGFLIIIYILTHRGFEPRKNIVGTISFLAILLVTAAIMDGSIQGFINRILLGLANSRLMLGDNWSSIQDTLWKGKVRITDVSLNYTVACTVIITLSIYLSSVKDIKAKFLSIFVALSSLAICSMIFIGWVENPLANISDRKRLVVATCLPIAIIISLIVTTIVTKHFEINKKQFTSCCLALLFAYAFVIGTAGNYFNTLMKALIFIVLASLIFLLSNSKLSHHRILKTIAYGTLALSFLLIHAGIQKPYRQPIHKLTDNSTVSPVNFLGKTLRLSKETSDYLMSLQSIIINNGHPSNLRIIDMTGYSPGIIYALEAKPLGAAWLLGGYIGSNERALASLKREPRDSIRRAWVITEPEGERPLSDNVLKQLNLNINEDYLLIGRITPPVGLGGRKGSYTQFVYKPKNHISLNSK